jgi:hypothetical protein
MRCKLCGMTQRIRGTPHSWVVNQHCAECHFMGRVPRGAKAKDYPKR